MKLRIDRDIFSDTVSWVSRGIQPNHPKPVLSGILLEASEDNVLTISSHDPEIGAKAVIDAEVEEEGKFLVTGRLLADFAKALPKKPIDLDTENGKLNIKCGSSNLSMNSLPIDDYPAEIPLPKKAGSIDGSVFQDAVSQVALAASNDDTLPLLVSICIEIKGSKITFMATDRYRLAVREIEW